MVPGLTCSASAISWLEILPLAVERGRQIVPRDLVPGIPPAPQLLVGRIRGAPVEPGAEGGRPPEAVDLATRGPEGVLHHLFRVGRAPGDADREPVHAIPVGADQLLRRTRLLPAQLRDQCRVPIHHRQSTPLLTANHRALLSKRAGTRLGMRAA